MAGVTIHTGIDVSGNTAVPFVRWFLSVALNADILFIIGRLVTIRTIIAAVSSGLDGEAMIKNPLCPIQMRGIVTVFTAGRKSGGLMVGVRGRSIVISMTAITIPRQDSP